MLKVKNVSKKYEQTNIGPFNFELEKNQLISIIGKSGAGKTTLLKMLAKVLNPDVGEITFNDKENFKDSISYITQKTMLFNHLTILENFKLLDIDLANIDKVLIDLKLEPTILEKYPFEISGGQAQRINFARVLMLKSQILILDEAFSALDVNSKDEIYDLIYSLMSKYQLLIILVTHDIQEAIMLSDKIIVMEKGKIVFQSEAKKLLLENSKYIDNLISPKRKKILQGLLYDEHN